jgi:hypothetical protein
MKDNELIRWGEQEMLFQRIQAVDSRGILQRSFYVCRLFGSREIWIQDDVLSAPECIAAARCSPEAFRLVQTDNGEIGVISVDWLMEKFPVSDPEREFFTNLERAFKADNSRGQLIGQRLW